MKDKEDSQLTCPVSYEDPSHMWDTVESQLHGLLPLHDVICVSPVTGQSVTISSLPLRFMPADANLFKDTNHPFRWFLAPYLSIYILKAESLGTYKAMRSSVKSWVEDRGKAPWFIIYACPNGPNDQSKISAYHEVYDKILADFCNNRRNERSFFVFENKLNLLNSDAEKYSSTSTSRDRDRDRDVYCSSPESITKKLHEGVVSSFLVRASLYESDIKSVESSSNSINSHRTNNSYPSNSGGNDNNRGQMQIASDFRQLFLVRESLALMYQMMQLPHEALVQYTELETILPYAPGGSANPSTTADNSNTNNQLIDENQNQDVVVEWPFSRIQDKKSKEKEKERSRDNATGAAGALAAEASTPNKQRPENQGTESEGQGHSTPQVTYMSPSAATPASAASASPDFATATNTPTPLPATPSDEGQQGSLSLSFYNNDINFTTVTEFSGPCKHGSDVLGYSINLVRKRILKSKIKALELQRYVNMLYV